MKKESSQLRCSPWARILSITIGGLLVIDTLFVYARSNLNLGVILPALIGIPLIILGLFLPAIKKLGKESKIVKALLWCASIGYALLAIMLCVTTALIVINSKEPEQKADVIIVLGGGIRGNYPSLTLKKRLDKAVEYMNENSQCMAIVSGGQGEDEIRTEASVMREYLIGHGIDEDRILTEDRSRSTEENFRFSRSLIESEFGPNTNVVFVTTRFHVFRAERVAAKQGMNTEGIPADGVWYITFNDYLREGFAITAYFLTGKI